jgi:mannitol-specific phosphotransferase system IIBC component
VERANVKTWWNGKGKGQGGRLVVAGVYVMGDDLTISIMLMIAFIFSFLFFGWIMTVSFSWLDKIIPPGFDMVTVILNFILAILAILATFSAFKHIAELINKWLVFDRVCGSIIEWSIV